MDIFSEIVNTALSLFILLIFVVFPLVVFCTWREPFICSFCGKKGREVSKEEKPAIGANEEFGYKGCVVVMKTYLCEKCGKKWTDVSPVIIVKS